MSDSVEDAATAEAPNGRVAPRRKPKWQRQLPRPSTGTTPENLKATRNIARLGMLNVVAAGVGAGLTFALTLVVTRGFGRSEGGAFFTETSLFIIVLTLVQMGTDQGLIWHLSHLQA